MVSTSYIKHHVREKTLQGYGKRSAVICTCHFRYGKYGNPVGELLTRSKQGSQLYYEAWRTPDPFDVSIPKDGWRNSLEFPWNKCSLLTAIGAMGRLGRSQAEAELHLRWLGQAGPSRPFRPSTAGWVSWGTPWCPSRLSGIWVTWHLQFGYDICLVVWESPKISYLEICFNKVPPTGRGLSRSLFWPVEWGWPISVFEFDRVNMFNPMIVPYYPMKHPIADLFWM